MLASANAEIFLFNMNKKLKSILKSVGKGGGGQDWPANGNRDNLLKIILRLTKKMGRGDTLPPSPPQGFEPNIHHEMM